MEFFLSLEIVVDKAFHGLRVHTGVDRDAEFVEVRMEFDGDGLVGVLWTDVREDGLGCESFALVVGSG